MAPRNTARTNAVKVLRAIAGRYDVERVSDNASKAKVTTMSQAILAAGDLTSEDRQAAKDAWGSYESTWSEDQDQGLAQGGIADGGASTATREWFFHAAQLTYSCTEGEWASKDKEVLKALFNRFVLYMQTMLTELQPKGISATMEESTKTGKPYRRGRVWNRGRAIVLDRWADWWGGHGGRRKCYVEALAAGLLEF